MLSVIFIIVAFDNFIQCLLSQYMTPCDITFAINSLIRRRRDIFSGGIIGYVSTTNARSVGYISSLMNVHQFWTFWPCFSFTFDIATTTP